MGSRKRGFGLWFDLVMEWKNEIGNLVKSDYYFYSNKFGIFQSTNWAQRGVN